MVSNVLIDRVEYLCDTKGKIELANRIVILEKRLEKIKKITDSCFDFKDKGESQ